MTRPTQQSVFTGIDWGDSHHQLCVLCPAGERLTQLRVPKEAAGLARLDTELARHGTALPVAVERAKGCWSSTCRTAGYAVLPV